MKKKMFSRVLVIGVLLLFVLSACGKNPDSSETKKKGESTENEGQAAEDGSESTEKTQAKPESYDASKAAAKYADHQKLPLWEKKEDIPFYEADKETDFPYLIPYIAEENTKGGCVLICPGGGYVNEEIGEKDSSEPAQALNENNITAFVLRYRLSPYDYHAMLADVCRAVRYIRYHAEDLGIDPDKIAVMGFSAGGHLATMAMEHYDEDEQKLDAVDKVSARPNYGILGYPVISLKEELTHKTTKEAFLGEAKDDAELVKKYSGEEGVHADMPPVFIWHCKKDKAVPAANSEAFAQAMQDAGVSCKLSIYEKGSHGIGLAEGYEEAKAWFPDCVAWLQGYGY